jgi:hypothetical protein
MRNGLGLKGGVTSPLRRFIWAYNWERYDNNESLNNCMDVNSMGRVRRRRGFELPGNLMRCAKMLNLLPQSAQNDK